MFKTILYNILFAMLISFLGGIGIFITRIAKGNWTAHTWSYIPIFWIPIFFSWPVALTVLFGGFNKKDKKDKKKKRR